MLRLFFLFIFFISCTTSPPPFSYSTPDKVEKKIIKKRGIWYIEPDVVKLNKYTEFQICGDKDLQNIILYVDASVDYSFKGVEEDGKCAKIGMIVESLSRGSSEELGKRRIELSVPTLDTMVVLNLRVRNDDRSE